MSEMPSQSEQSYQLVVVGGWYATWSLVASAKRAGLDRIGVIVLPETRGMGAELGISGADIFETSEVRLQESGEHDTALSFESSVITSQVAVVDLTGTAPSLDGAAFKEEGPEHRVHRESGLDAAGDDVLITGNGERVVWAAREMNRAGARVVAALPTVHEDLSSFARQALETLEREQRATVLWQSKVDHIWETDGHPMVTFSDRKTPDLQFDHVVVLDGEPVIADASHVVLASGVESRVHVIGASSTTKEPEGLTPSGAWPSIREEHFPDLPLLEAHAVTTLDHGEEVDLETKFYNATITAFDTAHNELWRIRVKPDRENIVHRAGQYCSLGLGYWEPRADDALDPSLEERMRKLIRRSYSISHPIFDRHGYLADQRSMDEIELYIVWVKPDGTRVPALTPRLALKNVGDRIYLGPKVAGRYTLQSLTDPDAVVIFGATGTGEAPHNAMIVELLRRGHRGPIISLVSVRYRADLAYLEEHRELEGAFPNYRYYPAPTREPDTPKRYLQDLVQDGTIEELAGQTLDPSTCHVFLCGNPAMIGLPTWDGEEPSFEPPVGMAQLLHERGFILDRRGVPGTVHYEEYW